MTKRPPEDGSVSRQRGWERRLRADRRKGERRRRAVLVEVDRRRGFDRRCEDRRKR